MTRRLVEYALVAIILCLVPCALWVDYVLPRFGPYVGLPEWETWLFAALVFPPSWVADFVMPGTAYGSAAAVTCGQSFWHGGGGIFYCPPPMTAAAEFLRVAIPFWYVVVTGVGELGIVCVNRISGRHQPVGATMMERREVTRV